MGPVGFLGPGFAASSVMYIILAESWGISVLDPSQPSDLGETVVGSKFCSVGGRWSYIVIVTIVILEQAAGRFRGRTDGRGASRVVMTTRVVCECWKEIMGRVRWVVKCECWLTELE